MYKFLPKKNVKIISDLEKEFCKISLILNKDSPKLKWWLHEISRLDFRPWGGLNQSNYIDTKINVALFLKNIVKDFIEILKFLLNGFFVKKKNFYFKNVFFSEKIIFNQKIKKDYFFQNIFSKTQSKIKILITLSTQKTENKISFENLVSLPDKIIIFFQSLISFFVLFYLLLKLVLKKKISFFWLKYFLIKERLKNIYINHILFKFIRDNKISKNIIIPYEEKTFERSLIYANSKKKIESQSNILAICINPQHILSSFLKNFKDLNIPRTEKYLFCGLLYRNYFNKLGRKNKLTNQRLDIIGSYKSKKKNIKLTKNKNILVLLSNIQEFYQLINFVKDKRNLLKYNYLIRHYPHASDKKSIIKNIIKYNLKNFNISNASLEVDIKKTFVTIFSATSAGIEAINHGRVGIWVNLSRVGMNPLFDQVNNFYPSHNSEDLNKKIEKVRQMSYPQYKKVINLQQKFCEKIYSKVNVKVIRKVLNS